MYCSKCSTQNDDQAKFCSQCGESFNREDVSKKYAGFWLRAFAFVIDFLFLWAITAIICFPIGYVVGLNSNTIVEAEAYATGWGGLAGILIQWLYFSVSESSVWQATIGKKIMKIKVIDYSGNRISFAKANGRHWSKIISALILFMGYFMVAFTDKKQGLHDKIAKTLIVKS
jgi:uncharacterized RDD family membrane protein YckC